MRRIRRGVDRLARFHDPGADAVNLESLFALDDLSEFVPFGVHVQRQSEAGLPGRRVQLQFLPR